jgi:hypothetical protein
MPANFFPAEPPVVFQEPHDLGDGLTAFRAGQETFSLDIVGFYRWYGSLFAQEKKPTANDIIDAVKATVAKWCGVQLNDRQADDLIHAVEVEQARIRSFREAQLQQARNSGLT